jgi:hypothetical protein
MKADIFVPQDLQRDMLRFSSRWTCTPIRLGDAPMICLCHGGLLEGSFQHRIADILSQRPR